MKKTLDREIGIKEKISFVSVNIGNIPIMTLANALLLIFYTDIVGLNPAAVGTLFLISRIFDGISDPLMGFILDKLPGTRFGKFRFYLFIGTIICSLNFLVLWFGPAYVPAPAKLMVAYATYILLGVTFDLMDISLNSLLPVMTTNLEERNLLSTLKGAGYIAGEGVFAIGAPMVLEAMDSSFQAYSILIIAGTAMVLLFSLGGVLGIKERVKAEPGQKYNLKELVKFFSLGPVFVTFAAQLILHTSQSINTASNIYFAKYIIGDIMILTYSYLFMGVGILPALLLNSLLVKKLGKRNLYAGSIVLTGLALLVRLFSVRSLWLLYGASVLGGLGAGFTTFLLYGIQADNIEYIDYIRGKRAEAAISSLSSFITKVANSIGGALPAYILAWTGYVANQTVQSGAAQQGIIAATIWVPGLLALAAGALFRYRYRLDSTKLERVNAELKKRKSGENASV